MSTFLISIRWFAKTKQINQGVTNIQVEGNEGSLQNFIKKYKLHTASILVCNHPNRVAQIHDGFKNFLLSKHP